MDEPTNPAPQFPAAFHALAGMDTSVLWASLLWGTIGMGYFIYGKKQRSSPALFGGIALMGISYFIASGLWMSVTAIAIMVGIWYWARQS
jgi:hypothetical protein